jgi:bifunctional non-homologous end joining protein LigD
MGTAYTLDEYNRKRDFDATPEPEGRRAKKDSRTFVVQKHAATRLHYDFRLEIEGVLKSWAIPKGPSLDPSDKRLAVRTEDHPVSYGSFEGVIPSGYGAGEVVLWDRGTWRPVGDPVVGLTKGELKFDLDGERLSGRFALIRMKPRRGETGENWLLIKDRDGMEVRGSVVTETYTTSVTSGLDLASIKARHDDAGRSDEGPDDLRFIKPQLATLQDSPPSGDDWIHEIKFDGYRIQALIDRESVRLLTRNEKDWTDKYPAIVQALSHLGLKQTIMDGELIALGPDGSAAFSRLQNHANDPDTTLRYYAFDLLVDEGDRVTDLPLLERKERLAKRIAKAGDTVAFSEHLSDDGETVLENACDLRIEGIISKRATARYSSGRGRDWIKSKCLGNDEYIIIGYRRSDKRGRPFSSLLLAEQTGMHVHYRGRVGTGFDEAAFAQLKAALRPLERKTAPIDDLPTDARRDAVFVEPRLLAQISYTELTDDGRLRHPSFLGLREDKELEPVARRSGSTANKSTSVGGVALSSVDKVLYPDQNVTKLDLARYYDRHADRILEHLANRPLSLVRCPSGRTGQCFFQKHFNASTPDELDRIEIEETKGKREPYLVVHDKAGLIASAQIGALELHLWGARTDRLDRPERLVFDLDPDEGLGFDAVKSAAAEVREVLDAAGLQAFPLVTGGKGVHVVVPLERRRGWADAKSFAHGLCLRLAEAAPDRYVAKASKAARKGRIFLDWLRNERGATAVAPYSPRARKGAPIAMPVTWEELGKLKAANLFSFRDVDALAESGRDPWEGYGELRQSITQGALEAVGAA